MRGDGDPEGDSGYVETFGEEESNGNTDDNTGEEEGRGDTRQPIKPRFIKW